MVIKGVEFYHIHFLLLFLSFINVMYNIFDFSDVKTTLYSWSKSHLFIMCNPLYIVLGSTHQYFVEDLCTHFDKRYWSVVLFSCNIFGFVASNFGLIESLGISPSCSKIWKVFEGFVFILF